MRATGNEAVRSTSQGWAVAEPILSLSGRGQAQPEECGPRIGLLGAGFTTGNRGVDTLTAGAIRCLVHRFREASVFVLDYGRAPRGFEVRAGGRVVPVELVPMRFSKNLLQRNHVARLLLVSAVARLLPGRVRRRVIAANPWLRELHAADFLCALSGGDSLSDLYGFQRLLYVALPQLLVLVNRKPLLLLPQTIGPFRTPWARALARLVLRGARLVFTREDASLDRVRELLGQQGVGDRVRATPDLGFVAEPAAPVRMAVTGLPEPLPPGRLLVGLNVSGLLMQGGYTHRNMFGLREDYRQIIDRLIEHLVERHEAFVLLVPHTFGPPGSEADAPVCQRLYEALATRYRGRVGHLDGEYAHDEIRYVAGRCDFFIGSRMHACIAAASQGVPVAAIAYSDKFRQTLAPVDGGVAVLDARTLTTEEVLEGITAALAARHQARRSLERRLPSVRREVLGLFDAVFPNLSPPRGTRP